MTTPAPQTTEREQGYVANFMMECIMLGIPLPSYDQVADYFKDGLSLTMGVLFWRESLLAGARESK